MKNKTIILASESPELYTTRRLLEEAKKLNYSSSWLNPYQYLINHNNNRESANFENGLYFHRTTGIRYDDFDLLVSEDHLKKGFTVTNRIEALTTFRDKEKQSLFLERHKLSPINTVSYRGRLNEKNWGIIETLSPNHQYVLKMARGNQGIGVNLINGLKSLRSLLETFEAMKDQKFIIQPFIEHKREWRIFVIKNQIIGIIERQIDESEFRGNSKRAHGKCLKKIDPQLENEIIRGAHLSGLDYFGVDVIADKDQFYFLEFNPVPGFEQLEELSGLNIARELITSLAL